MLIHNIFSKALFLKTALSKAFGSAALLYIADKRSTNVEHFNFLELVERCVALICRIVCNFSKLDSFKAVRAKKKTD